MNARVFFIISIVLVIPIYQGRTQLQNIYFPTWHVVEGEKYTFHMDYCRKNGNIENANYSLFKDWDDPNPSDSWIIVKEGENFSVEITTINSSVYGILSCGNISSKETGIGDYFMFFMDNNSYWEEFVYNKKEKIDKDTYLVQEYSYINHTYREHVIMANPTSIHEWTKEIDTRKGVGILADFKWIPTDSILKNWGNNHYRYFIVESDTLPYIPKTIDIGSFPTPSLSLIIFLEGIFGYLIHRKRQKRP